MCLNPIKVGHDRYPCGKCYECIKSKQMDYAQMMMFQAVKRHSAHFVTFTYSDDTRPVRVLNRVTGEIFWADKPCIYRDDYLESVKVDQKISHSPWRKYVHVEFYRKYGEGSLVVSVFSLRRRDFRLWLKKARVAYERKFNEKLPDFSYFCVGEYGEKTYAPHYHAMFFGLAKRHLDFMLDLWKKQYGFCMLKELPVMSSQDVSRCCMYVAKYMNKGCYDCPELTRKDSIMEKPRIMCSSGMAVRDGLRSLFTLNGKLSIYAGSYQISDLEQVIGRMKSCFGEQNLSIGKHFYQRALRVPNETLSKPSRSSDCEVEYYQITYTPVRSKDKIEVYKSYHAPSSSKFKASPLQVALSYLLQNMACESDSRERKEYFGLFEASHELREIFGSFENYWRSVLSSMQAVADSRQRKVQQKSVF